MKGAVCKKPILTSIDKFGRWSSVRRTLLLFASGIILPAQTFTTLATFNGANGSNPSALTHGADGNFYGTTAGGGVHGYGTIFKMTPSGTLTTLYSFCSLFACSDGLEPLAGLIQARDGNFYGTTPLGGAVAQDNPNPA